MNAKLTANTMLGFHIQESSEITSSVKEEIKSRPVNSCTAAQYHWDILAKYDLVKIIGGFRFV